MHPQGKVFSTTFDAFFDICKDEALSADLQFATNSHSVA